MEDSPNTTNCYCWFYYRLNPRLYEYDEERITKEMFEGKLHLVRRKFLKNKIATCCIYIEELQEENANKNTTIITAQKRYT